MCANNRHFEKDYHGEGVAVTDVKIHYKVITWDYHRCGQISETECREHTNPSASS